MICAFLATLACALAARALPGNSIAIQDVTSGLWIVSYTAATNLAPLGTSVTQATIFDVAEQGGTGAFVLRNYETYQFMTADWSGTAPVASARSEASTDEKFFFLQTGTNTYIIKANSNSLYLQTIGGTIYNNATQAGASVYTIVAQTAPVTVAEGTLGEVFIEDITSSLYVTVSGSSALVPTTSVRANGAIFRMYGDTLATIEYLTTGEFVTATMPGNQPLTATVMTPSTWEEYSVFYLTSGRYAIKANSNGLYLQTTSAGIVNSAFSQASGSVYNLVNANPGRR